jgi:hypothetical protein
MAITIEKACIYLALILLIIVLIYLKSRMDLIEEKEGFENTKMYISGPGIGRDVPVQSTHTIKGVKIYMIQDGPLTKMVSSRGEARYYKGKIGNFNALIWAISKPAKGMYKIKYSSTPTLLTKTIPKKTAISAKNDKHTITKPHNSTLVHPTLVHPTVVHSTSVPKLSNNYEFKHLNYKGAVEYCKSKGKKLCSASEYCSNGKPIYNVDEIKKWGAISDYPDGWIQLGKSGDVCKTEKQINVADREVAIMCCDRKIQPLVINAIHIDGQTKTLFKGKYYQSISNTNVSKVMNISTFRGLSTNFKNGDIDAITITSDANISLWFKRSHLMVYDNKKHLGNEMEIVEYFSGLPKDFSEGSIDAIATRGPNTEYIMFKKTRYCIVDMGTNKFISVGNIAERYKTLPRDFQLGYFDCAVYSETPNCSYIMKNDKMVEYNFSTNSIVKGPIEISSVLNILLPPFISRDKVCPVYERLMKVLPNNKYWEMMYYTECKRITMKEYEMNLENYRNIVKRYEETYNKEMEDSKKMEVEIAKYEKLLKDKQEELKGYKDKLLEIGNVPCKDEVCATPPTCKSKSILVYENDDVNAQQFYQVDKKLLKNCMNDVDIGENYPGGFNFFKHPKFNEYKKA